MKFSLFSASTFVSYLFLAFILFSSLTQSMSSISEEELSRTEWVEMEPSTSSMNSKLIKSEANPDSIHSFLGRANGELSHECVFHLNSPGHANLESLVNQISDPKSKMYGKHMTKSEMDAMLDYPEGKNAVTTYLNRFPHVSIKSQGSTSITASAPLSTWERVFNTQFHEVKSQVLKNDESIYRATHYYLPKEIAPHIQMVTNTVQLPVALHHGPVRVAAGAHVGRKAVNINLKEN
jgi:subtilase family serine protease